MAGNLPKPLINVTGGPGGLATLIKGKKNVLHDCGMACFHRELIENIEDAIGVDGTLDYVILSHTHYDHVGALPYVIKRWPNVKVCAGKKAADVFSRTGAINMIISMGKTAAEQYNRDQDEINADGLRVDIALESEDIIQLGDDERIIAMVTKGHTDCSMTYLIQPYGILFLSESTGVMEERNILHTSILKSYDDSIESTYLLKSLPYKEIIMPHYGALPENLRDGYFERYLVAAEEEQSLIANCIRKGMSVEETLEVHKSHYWSEERGKNQPYRAYEMNTEIAIKRVMREIDWK